MPEAVARQNLSAHLWRLREIFGVESGMPIIASDKHAVWLVERDRIWLDVTVFERACTNIINNADASLTELHQYRAELELYCADLLEGLDGGWFVPARERLRLSRASAIETLIQRYITAGSVQDALELAIHLVHFEPLHEEAHCLLVQLHLVTDHIEEARQCFQQYQALWQTELGLPPSTRMAALAQQHRLQIPDARRDRDIRRDARLLNTMTRELLDADQQTDESFEIVATREDLRADCIRFAIRLGQLFRSSFDNLRALAHFRFALKLLRASCSGEAPMQEIEVRRLCDEIYDLTNDHPAQHKNLKCLEALTAQLGDASVQLDATLRRAWFEAQRNRHEATLTPLLELERSGLERHPIPSQSLVLRVMAVIEQESGKLQQAIAHAQRAIVLDESVNHTTGIAAALVTLASAMIARGEYAEALTHAKRSYDLQGTPQLSTLRARILGILGLSEMRAGTLDIAHAHLQEALHLARALGDINSSLWIIHTLCELYLRQGAVESARTLAMGHLEIAVRCDNPLMAAQFTLLIAQTHLQAGNYAQALDYARSAGKLAKHRYLWRYNLQAMLHAGEALLCMQKPKSATRYAQAAVHLFHTKGHKLAEEADLMTLADRCQIEWPQAATPTDIPTPAHPRPQ